MPDLVLPTAILALATLLVASCGGSSGPDPPDSWDPRILDLVEFTETKRGLDFLHPVAIDFLDEEEFLVRYETDTDLSDEDRREIEQITTALRALGLVPGELDLLAALEDIAAGGVTAYYDHGNATMGIRGDGTLTARTRATVVHELTHALQDQHFDLSRTDSDDATEGEDFGFSAIVEADAERIEGAFIAALSPFERREYDSAQSAADPAALDDVPPVLLEAFLASRVLGEYLLAALFAIVGETAADDALRDPPMTVEQVIDAERYLERDPALAFDPPALEDGEDLLAADLAISDSLVVLLLGERVGFDLAWRAADGWGGGSSVLFRRGETDCVRIAIAGDSERDLDELMNAFRVWVLTMPDAAAERVDGVALLASCDPGSDFKPPPSPDAHRTFSQLVFRAELIEVLREVGFGDHARATCIVDEMRAVFGMDRLRELAGRGASVAEVALVQRERDAAASGCVLA